MRQDAGSYARMARVLSGALGLWGVAGSVRRDADEPGTFVISRAGGAEIRIVHCAPHGWLLLPDNVAHAGLPGLLRQLREELAPHAARGRLVIGPQSLP